MSLFEPRIIEQDPELHTAIQAMKSDTRQIFNITFAGSTNHGVQQACFSGQQTNHFGAKP